MVEQKSTASTLIPVVEMGRLAKAAFSVEDADGLVAELAAELVAEALALEGELVSEPLAPGLVLLGVGIADKPVAHTTAGFSLV